MFVKCELLLPRVRFLCVGDARLAIEKTSAWKNYDMTIPLFDRLSLAERREQRRKAQTRYRQKHREKLLQKKREYLRAIRVCDHLEKYGAFGELLLPTKNRAERLVPRNKDILLFLPREIFLISPAPRTV